MNFLLSILTSFTFVNCQVDLDGDIHTVEQLLGGRKTLRLSGCRVDGIRGNLYVKALKDGDLLFIFGTAKIEYLAQLYKKC